MTGGSLAALVVDAVGEAGWAAGVLVREGEAVAAARVREGGRECGSWRGGIVMVHFGPCCDALGECQRRSRLN